MVTSRPEWLGYWIPKPGSILANGAIVVADVGDTRHALTVGEIYIETRRLAQAKRFGWKFVSNAGMGKGLVPLCRVRRDVWGANP